MVVVLVCGSRTWSDQAMVHTVLDGLRAELVEGEHLMVVEGCARGADHYAHHYTGDRVVHAHHPADWTRVAGLAPGGTPPCWTPTWTWGWWWRSKTDSDWNIILTAM